MRCAVPCALAALALLVAAVGPAGVGALPSDPAAGVAVESNAVEEVERGGRARPGAGRAVLAEMARELISRSATSSQVRFANLCRF